MLRNHLLPLLRAADEVQYVTSWLPSASGLLLGVMTGYYTTMTALIEHVPVALAIASVAVVTATTYAVTATGVRLTLWLTEERHRKTAGLGLLRRRCIQQILLAAPAGEDAARHAMRRQELDHWHAQLLAYLDRHDFSAEHRAMLDTLTPVDPAYAQKYAACSAFDRDIRSQCDQATARIMAVIRARLRATL